FDALFITTLISFWYNLYEQTCIYRLFKVHDAESCTFPSPPAEFLQAGAFNDKAITLLQSYFDVAMEQLEERIQKSRIIKQNESNLLSKIEKQKTIDHVAPKTRVFLRYFYKSTLDL